MCQAVIVAVFPFAYLNIFNRRVATTDVGVLNESRFLEADTIGFVRGGSK
jgi:hypothetical protein